MNTKETFHFDNAEIFRVNQKLLKYFDISKITISFSPSEFPFIVLVEIRHIQFGYAGKRRKKC